MRELLARLTSLELSEWEAWYQLGGERAVAEELKARALQGLGNRRR